MSPHVDLDKATLAKLKTAVEVAKEDIEVEMQGAALLRDVLCAALKAIGDGALDIEVFHKLLRLSTNWPAKTKQQLLLDLGVPKDLANELGARLEAFYEKYEDRGGRGSIVDWHSDRSLNCSKDMILKEPDLKPVLQGFHSLLRAAAEPPSKNSPAQLRAMTKKVFAGRHIAYLSSRQFSTILYPLRPDVFFLANGYVAEPLKRLLGKEPRPFELYLAAMEPLSIALKKITGFDHFGALDRCLGVLAQEEEDDDDDGGDDGDEGEKDEVVEEEDDEDVEDVCPEAAPGLGPSIYDFLKKTQELRFSTEMVTSYLLALKTKPFVILSGISGTGKTKLAQAVAQWATGWVPAGKQAPGAQQKRNWAFISVRPDWLDTKEVLGFYNLLTNGYEMRPFLELLLRAHRECIEGKPPRPFFVILDEMNIARIEHYFADLLSVTESRLGDGKVVTEESLDLHRQSRCLALGLGGNTSLPAKCGLCNGTDEEVAGCPLYLDGNQLVPRRLRMPRNVYITGTVNVDETTHMFSPKVLDRANVIEFNEVLLEDAPEAAGHQSGFVLKHGGVDLGGFQETAKWKHFAKAPGNTRQWIRDVNALLERHGLHFGYRVANEIALFVAHANEAVGSGALEVALDLQMLQKILPKLHGSRQKLERPLWDLLVFAVLGANPPAELGEFNEERFHEWAEALAGDNPVPVSSNDKREPLMPRSARKLARMLQTAITEGFVSFIQ